MKTNPTFGINEQVQQLASLLLEAEQANVQDDPYFDFLIREVGVSRLGQGKPAQKALSMTHNMIQARAIVSQLMPDAPRDFPNLVPEQCVCIGCCAATGRPIFLPVDSLTLHLLILGPTGSGKTTFLWLILNQLIRRNIQISFQDYKNEGRRLLNNPDIETLVLSIDKQRENLLEPVGDPKTYYAAFWGEFAKGFGLRTETWMKPVDILVRIGAGLADGECYPSLKDFEILLRKISDDSGDKSLRTVSVALRSLNSALGRAAYVRRGPVGRHHVDVVANEYQGLPPRLLQFISAIRLLRFQLAAREEGHTSELRSIYLSDEGSLEFSKELSSTTGSGYISPQKRLVTQVRSSGTGILVGVQTLGDIDNVLKSNVGTFVCLGARSPGEAREAAVLLNHPADRAVELQSLPLGVGFIRSEDYPEPIKFISPNVDAGAYISDAEVEERMRPAQEWLDAHTTFSEVQEDIGGPIDYREILGEKIHVTDQPEVVEEEESETVNFNDQAPQVLDEWRQLLLEINAHPEAGVRQHYRNLRWSDGRGTRVRDLLLANGLIVSDRYRDPAGGRPREILKITQSGKEFQNVYGRINER